MLTPPVTRASVTGPKKDPKKSRNAVSSRRRFAIVASQYNARYVDSMLRAAKRELTESGATVEVFRVPGAFEIPVVVGSLVREEIPPSAVVCLGVILRGATTHAQHIGDTISRVLGGLQADFGVPLVHEVLLLENEQQAKERCLDAGLNRGLEAARTALAMASVMERLHRRSRRV